MRLQKKRRRRIAAKKRLWRNVPVPVTAQCSKEATVSMHTQATRPLYPSKKTAQNATTTPSLEHKGGEDRRVRFGKQGHRKRNTQLQGKEGGGGIVVAFSHACNLHVSSQYMYNTTCKPNKEEEAGRPRCTPPHPLYSLQKRLTKVPDALA